MATIAETFAQALQHHQAGQLTQAEELYRGILQNQPNHVNALHLLGVLLHGSGRPEQALECIRQAALLCPNEAAIHYNQGLVHRTLGQPEQALACWRQALACRPDLVEARVNLGGLLAERGLLQEAADCYRQALHWRPDCAEAHNNLGNLLRDQGRPAEASACYRQALRLRPDYAEAHLNLGVLLKDQGLFHEAVACYHEALRLHPGFPEAHNNLGVALCELDQLDEAVACLHRALQLRPAYAEAHYNLGVARAKQGRWDEAGACYRQALALQPDYPLAHNNLGVTFGEQGRLDEAIACYSRALDFQPDYADAHRNRALVWLLQGNYAQGWPEWEWRWRCKEFVPPRFEVPRWDGAALGGRTILLYAEQGLGDTLQFIRYAALVKQRGGRIVVECQAAVLPLLTDSPDIDQVVAQGEPLPAFDVEAPLLSLPTILGTTLQNIPARIPYLAAQPSLVERWRAQLRQGRFKIGIAWQGNPAHKRDRWRSAPLAQFAALAATPHVCLYSLQKGAGLEQLGAAGFPLVDLGSRLNHFADTAAVLQSLDLVVTVDSAVAHCAGALGVPVWVALPFAPDWRWLLQREDSPWYPSMRLFRQQELGQWQEVFQRIAAEVRTLAAGR